MSNMPNKALEWEFRNLENFTGVVDVPRFARPQGRFNGTYFKHSPNHRGGGGSPTKPKSQTNKENKTNQIEQNKIIINPLMIGVGVKGR